MKLKNTSYIFLLILFFFSCTAKKSTIEYKERIVKDTIYKKVKETIVERFTDTLTIENPCDSLGNLKPFKQIVKVKQGNYTLKGINNTITAEIDLNAYKSIWEKEYESKNKSSIDTKEVEIIRYKTPLWLILLCPILLGVGYLIGRFRII